jgi:hypothetical protein
MGFRKTTKQRCYPKALKLVTGLERFPERTFACSANLQSPAWITRVGPRLVPVKSEKASRVEAPGPGLSYGV